MKRQREYSNRPVRPIFGYRKRPREAVYADSIEFQSSEADDEMLLHCIPTQRTMPSKGTAYELQRSMKNQDQNNFEINENTSHRSKYSTNSFMQKNKSYSSPSIPLLPAPTTTSKQHRNHQRNTTQHNCFFSNNKISHPMEHTETMVKIHHQSDQMNKSSHGKVVQENVKRLKTAARLITSNIQRLSVWTKFSEEIQIMFELFGKLDSTIAYNNTNPQKSFTLKDSTASIRCMFWEIDRRLPKISRGSLIRCVGRWQDGYIHCVSVRPSSNEDLKLSKFLLTQSEEVLQKEFLSAREK